MAETVDLDNVMLLDDADPEGMLTAVESFPKQCSEALRLGRDMMSLPPKEEIERMAFVGMGGSGMAGDILRVLTEEAVGMPISVHKGYRLPSLLGPDTLVFMISYSGNTEETLSALEDAVYLGCRVVAVTCGGKLLEMARGHDFPYIVVPEGLQPRAALGYLSLPAAAVIEKMGFIQGFVKVAYDAVEYLKTKSDEWGRLNPTERNFAKRLASRLADRIPVIYGTEGILGVAAYRWKCQFNENSKVPAFYNVLPEMNHNEIVGWQRLDDVTSKVEAVFLVDDEDTPRITKRVRITSDILEEKVGGVTVIHVGGKTRTERLLSAIYLGDFVSSYLALIRGVDPTPVETITLLKHRMAEEE
jgi:glucose/mannose-6-phosphate isomerase